MRSGEVAVAAVVAMMIGCVGGGNSGASAAYNAAEDCKQYFACGLSDLTSSECASEFGEWYSDQSVADQSVADKAYSSCRAQTGCDYVSCFDSIWNSESSSGTGEESPASVCSASVTANNTSVPYDGGTLEFSAVEARFWVNFKGCLTGVDIDLQQGECTLSVSANDFTDSDGRLLIRSADLRTGGLCPGFPDDIENARSYHTHSDQDAMLGTIEIIKPSSDWKGCEEGDVVLRSNINLSNIDGASLDLTAWTLTLSGYLAQTHTSLDDPCPTEYF